MKSSITIESVTIEFEDQQIICPKCGFKAHANEWSPSYESFPDLECPDCGYIIPICYDQRRGSFQR